MHLNSTENGFCASYVNGHRMSVAQLDKISPDIFQEDVKREIKPDEVWFWFTRLKVHPQDRGRGIATQLLGEVAKWADQNKINIFLGINPYGDLDLAQLIQLYSKFGFKLIGEDIMIREVS